MRPSPQASPTRSTFLSPIQTGGSALRPSGPPLTELRSNAFLRRQYTGGNVSPTKGIYRIPHGVSCQTGTAIEVERPLLPVARHMTGTIAALTQQLTGQGFSPEKATFSCSNTSEPRTSRHRRTLTTIPTSPKKVELSSVTEESEFRNATEVGKRSARSGSPTKWIRPRPKSVLGIRHGVQRSIDDNQGRGMFLVHQMTGSR